MDNSVDKELVGWLHPDGIGQCLSVLMATGDEWCPSRAILGSVLFNDIESSSALSANLHIRQAEWCS